MEKINEIVEALESVNIPRELTLFLIACEQESQRLVNATKNSNEEIH